MASVNRVTLIGNLGADPETRHTGNGQAVCNFRIATTEKWGGKDGQAKQEKTEWHSIVAWSKTAELCAEYLRKGSQVYVEGRLQTREWQDKDGQKRFTTEIVASQVVFLGGKDRGGGGGGQQRQTQPAGEYDDSGWGSGGGSGDVPF